MDEKSRKELETIEIEHQVGVIRHDLPGDALKSARLVLAAKEKKWSEVKKMLDGGADPRICRYADTDGQVESALYFALKDMRFILARELYEAGDRLDDLICAGENIPESVVSFLAFEMSRGKNYYYDPSKPLFESCQQSTFYQIKKLTDSASLEEMNRSIEPLVRQWICHFNNPIYIGIMETFIARGAKLAEPVKKELLAKINSLCSIPSPWNPDKETVEKMVSLVSQA
jgi:hypothetical protein